MKQKIISVLFTGLLLQLLFVPPIFAQSDIELHRDCRQCGMDRKAFGYSRMMVEYKDGRQAGTCSLHCVVTELSSREGEVNSFKVADRNTRQLIDAEKAVWVIGGTKRGVMTTRAKWAFATKEAAHTFVEAYGGTIADWDKALSAAKEDARPKSR